jgi:hypothetical protein
LPHHDRSLRLDVAHLILCDHVGLFQNFDGKILTRGLLLGQVDAPKSAFAYWFDDLEVLDGGLG